VRFPFPPAGEPAALVSEGLKDPSQLTVDKDGSIYVSDKGLNQVKVFTPEGKPLRTIGEPGGPRTGKYDPRRMASPEGLAISPDGKLWVAEYFHTPRRISIWTLDGTFVKDLIGNAPYGGGGELDPKDRSLAYVSYCGGTMQFRLDWEEGASALESILYLAGQAKTALPMHAWYSRPFQRAVYLNRAIRLTQVGISGRMARHGGLPDDHPGVRAAVRDGGGLPRVPVPVAVAGRLPVPAVWTCEGLAAHTRADPVRGVCPADLGDGGHDLPGHPQATAAVVSCDLVRHQPEDRGECAGAAASAGVGQL